MKKTTKQHLSDVNKLFSINKEGLKKPFIFRYFSILRATKEPVSIWIQVWGLDDRMSVSGGVFSMKFIPAENSKDVN